MSKYYNRGPYGVNAYSAAGVVPGEAVVAAAYSVVAPASKIGSGQATVAGAYTIPSPTANKLQGGRATVSGVFQWSLVDGDLLAGAAAVIAGTYLIDADARVVGIKKGEATILGDFNIEFMTSVLYAPRITLSAEYTIDADAYAGKMWLIEPVDGNWNPVDLPTDIWTKEPQAGTPWR